MVVEVWIYVVFFFAGIRLIVSMINAFSALRLPSVDTGEDKLVSVLLPARNEENNLPALLQQLSMQTYSNLEILVYDDHSTDNTANIVNAFSRKDVRIRLVPPESLPEGWLGKNFACHKLSQQAKGEALLFLDADVQVSDTLIANAVGFFNYNELKLLSIFPSQEMKTWGEWLTVPLMNWILLSLLPLALVRKSRRPSLAAANGQFMMFDADNYRDNHWHEQVKNNLVEDIVIIRKMKTFGYKTATLLGNNDVICRMYSSFREGVRGFSKNVIEFFGGSCTVAVVFSILIISGFALPFAIDLGVFAAYLALIILIRVMISLASKQSWLKNIYLHIPQMITFIGLVIKGCRVRRTGKYLWKDRSIG